MSEQLHFAEPVYNGRLTQIPIHVVKDGRVEKKATGLVTFADDHPPYLQVTVGETFYMDQLVQIAQHVSGMAKPEAPPARQRSHRPAQRPNHGAGAGKMLKPQTLDVLGDDLKVGDVLEVVNGAPWWGTVSSLKRNKKTVTVRTVFEGKNENFTIPKDTPARIKRLA